MAGTRHDKVVHPKELVESKESFNTKVAKGLGSILGNMKFFWFCVLLDIAELPAMFSNFSLALLITYVAQTVIQLLALPVLQVYQNIITTLSDAKADADHVALTHIANAVDEIKGLMEQK